jgi:hypothetical protein
MELLVALVGIVVVIVAVVYGAGQLGTPYQPTQPSERTVGPASTQEQLLAEVRQLRQEQGLNASAQAAHRLAGGFQQLACCAGCLMLLLFFGFFGATVAAVLGG